MFSKGYSVEGWLRGVDLNHRPLGYEPNELPDCSTPRSNHNNRLRRRSNREAGGGGANRTFITSSLQEICQTDHVPLFLAACANCA